jgi:acyl-CoA thioesterase
MIFKDNPYRFHPYQSELTLAPWEFEQRGNLHYAGTFSKDWYQGKGVFGGIVAAAFMHATCDALVKHEVNRKPRTMTVHFMAAPQAIETELLLKVEKTGRLVSFVSARMLQNRETVALATITLGHARDKDHHTKAEVIYLPPRKAPQYPDPKLVFEVPQDMPLMPTYCKYLSYRFCAGDAPYSKSTNPITGGYSQFRENYRLGYAHLCAMLDTWPPAFFACLSKPSAAATVDLTYHFYTQEPELCDPPFLYHGEILGMMDGYADEKGFLWDFQGRALASARQLIALG